MARVVRSAADGWSPSPSADCAADAQEIEQVAQDQEPESSLLGGGAADQVVQEAGERFVVEETLLAVDDAGARIAPGRQVKIADHDDRLVGAAHLPFLSHSASRLASTADRRRDDRSSDRAAAVLALNRIHCPGR